jgi:hypothetical protein
LWLAELSLRLSSWSVLIRTLGRIEDPTVAPRCWVVPLPDLEPYLHMHGTRLDVLRSSMQEHGERFEDAWSLITGEPTV